LGRLCPVDDERYAPDMDQRLGRQAVVIGGSVAGLMAARVLADHFESVTVLERDAIENRPSLHRSIPHGHHYHALLLGGQQVLSSLFDGFADELHGLGAVRFRLGTEIAFFLPGGKAYTMSGAVKEPRDLGFDAHSQSRGLIEHCVRQRALAVPEVRLQTGCTVRGLVHQRGRVGGVRCEGPAGTATLTADLVVDTGGRGSHAPRWLEELGVARPPETTIGVDFAYASTKYRLRGDRELRESLLGFFGPAPRYPNGAYLGAIEDGMWHVSLAGRFGDYPPTDEPGFLAFAASLHTPRLHEIIKDAERVADIVGYRFPTSIQRHYEQLPSFPPGFLVLGDAICSFNPIYGQGMSAAALQVQALQHVLRECRAGSGNLEGLASAFFPRAAQVIATPWTLAASLDFAYPQTVGDRSSLSRERGQYFAALNALAGVDVEVQKLMTEVFHLARPLSALMDETLRSRVLAQAG
jgi:2-polyprenyl-6-methoxyphenol hydroxylase-like FAD-dependent oxidoreductase